MDDTTLLLLGIFWLGMLGLSYFVAQSHGRSTTEALILTILLGPIGVLIVLFQKPANV